MKRLYNLFFNPLNVHFPPDMTFFKLNYRQVNMFHQLLYQIKLYENQKTSSHPLNLLEYIDYEIPRPINMNDAEAIQLYSLAVFCDSFHMTPVHHEPLQLLYLDSSQKKSLMEVTRVFLNRNSSDVDKKKLIFFSNYLSFLVDRYLIPQVDSLFHDRVRIYTPSFEVTSLDRIFFKGIQNLKIVGDIIKQYRRFFSFKSYFERHPDTQLFKDNLPLSMFYTKFADFVHCKTSDKGLKQNYQFCCPRTETQFGYKTIFDSFTFSYYENNELLSKSLFLSKMFNYNETFSQDDIPDFVVTPESGFAINKNSRSSFQIIGRPSESFPDLYKINTMNVNFRELKLFLQNNIESLILYVAAYYISLVVNSNPSNNLIDVAELLEDILLNLNLEAAKQTLVHSNTINILARVEVNPATQVRVQTLFNYYRALCALEATLAVTRYGKEFLEYSQYIINSLIATATDFYEFYNVMNRIKFFDPYLEIAKFKISCKLPGFVNLINQIQTILAKLQVQKIKLNQIIIEKTASVERSFTSLYKLYYILTTPRDSESCNTDNLTFTVKQFILSYGESNLYELGNNNPHLSSLQPSPMIVNYNPPPNLLNPPFNLFNPLVNQLNLPPNQLNPLVNQLNPLVNQFNPLVNQFNPLVNQLNLPPNQLNLFPNRLNLPPNQLNLFPNQLNLPPNQLNLPPDQLNLPPNQLNLFPNQLNLPPNQLDLFPNQLNLPPNQLNLPPNQLNMFPNQLNLPPNQLNLPPNQLNLPPNQLNMFPNQLNLPPDQLNLPPDQLNLPPDQLNLFPNQLNLPPNQLNLPPNQLNLPPNQLNLPPYQLNLPSNQLNPPSDQMNPPSNQLNPPSDQMNPPSNQSNSSPNQLNLNSARSTPPHFRCKKAASKSKSICSQPNSTFIKPDLTSVQHSNPASDQSNNLSINQIINLTIDQPNNSSNSVQPSNLTSHERYKLSVKKFINLTYDQPSNSSKSQNNSLSKSMSTYKPKSSIINKYSQFLQPYCSAGPSSDNSKSNSSSSNVNNVPTSSSARNCIPLSYSDYPKLNDNLSSNKPLTIIDILNRNSTKKRKLEDSKDPEDVITASKQSLCKILSSDESHFLKFFAMTVLDAWPHHIQRVMNIPVYIIQLRLHIEQMKNNTYASKE